MPKDWRATARIRGDGSYTVTGDWSHRGELGSAEDDNSDDEAESFAEETVRSSRERKEEREREREEKEEKRESPTPSRPKILSRQQERSERNRREYLASQSVSAAPPAHAVTADTASTSSTSTAVAAAPPQPHRPAKTTPELRRRESLLSGEKEKEPPPMPLKTGRERERERLRMQSVKKDGPKAKKTSAPVQQGVTIVFVEDRRGSERGLQVQIGREVIGTFWSAGLNLDNYHGRVGSIYRRVAQALLHVFDLETQSFTSDSVSVAGYTWTLEER